MIHRIRIMVTLHALALASTMWRANAWFALMTEQQQLTLSILGLPAKLGMMEEVSWAARPAKLQARARVGVLKNGVMLIHANVILIRCPKHHITYLVPNTRANRSITRMQHVVAKTRTPLIAKRLA
jgi:hypothetical protein